MLYYILLLKDVLPGLRQFLATESPLKLMQNAFYFTLEALFVLKIYIFFSDFFGHAGKRLDKKVKGNIKIYDVINWETSNYNTHITQYFKK